MDPTNGAHSDDPWDQEILALTAIALPPLPDINPHGDSSQGNHQFAVGRSSSSGPIVEKQDYMQFSPQEIEMLIKGVHENGRNWTKIMLYYFKDSGRTETRLKDKWRHMLTSADKETNPGLKELYLRAKDVDARYPRNHFRGSVAE